MQLLRDRLQLHRRAVDVEERRHELAVAVEDVRALGRRRQRRARSEAIGLTADASVCAAGTRSATDAASAVAPSATINAKVTSEAGEFHGCHQDGTRAAPSARLRRRRAPPGPSAGGASRTDRINARTSAIAAASSSPPITTSRAASGERNTKTQRSTRSPVAARHRDRVRGALHPVVREPGREIGLVADRVGLVVDDDERIGRVGVAVHEVDVALEREALDRDGDVGLAPVLAGARGRDARAADRGRARARRWSPRSRARPRPRPARPRGRRGPRRSRGRRSGAPRAPPGRSRCRSDPCSTAAARGRGPPWRPGIVARPRASASRASAVADTKRARRARWRTRRRAPRSTCRDRAAAAPTPARRAGERRRTRARSCAALAPAAASSRATPPSVRRVSSSGSVRVRRGAPTRRGDRGRACTRRRGAAASRGSPSARRSPCAARTRRSARASRASPRSRRSGGKSTCTPPSAPLACGRGARADHDRELRPLAPWIVMIRTASSSVSGSTVSTTRAPSVPCRVAHAR